MIGMGFVKTWGQLSGLRVVLGVLEAGYFPSCVYLLSTWYTRFEVHKRYSVRNKFPRMQKEAACHSP